VPSSPQLDEISPELVKQARRRTRDQLGADVEGKATDAFCVAFGISPAGAFAESGGPAGAFAEAMPAPTVSAPAVLEMSADPEPAGELPAEVEATVATTVRESVGGALDDLAHAETALALLVRQARVKAAREDFLRRAGLIRDEVERATFALQRGVPGRGRLPEAERLLVELCWLNRTMRTADARSMSAVAGDSAVERVDVPRRLEADAAALDVTLKAAADVRARHGLSGKGVTVAVIDSEAALRHPALRDRIIHRRNFTQEAWGTPGAHGTAVAGIIGADSTEYTGMAPDVTIYNYKVLATHRTFNATDFEGALAIQQALEDGVRVANCSWGAGPASDGTSREARACDRAWRFGLTVVKSAGNNGPGQRTLTTPADAEGVIVVGATGDDGRAIESYSSRGPTGHNRTRPHLVAPGGRLDVGLEGLLVGGGIGEIGWGTSYAAPHVTGLLALLLERNPELSPTAQRDALLKACKKLGRVSKNQQGAGLVEPARLFAAE
jgi:serine protease AprX